jgi:pilus assembly protein CpaE
MSNQTLILASTSEEWEERVRKAFDGRLNGNVERRPDVCSVGDTGAAVAALLDGEPEVVVLGPGIDMRNALELARIIDRERHDVVVVLVADATPELWKHALRAGVRDVVAPDASLVDLRSTIERAHEAASRRRPASSIDITTQAVTKIIAVVSPKGGAGKTAIASNLAVGLARHQPNEVVLVDLDLQFGDVANALRLTPETSMADAARSLGALDVTTLKAFLTPHPAGLFVLGAPDEPAAADEIDPEHVSKVLDLLAGAFRYVVIDTAAGLDEVTLVAMEHSTDLVVVGATDVASVRAARKELEAFDLLGLTAQRRHFALNRADARVGLSTADIEATVGMRVDVAIPSSRAVPLSMNQGTAVLENDERSAIGRAFGDLANRFHVAPPTSGAQPSVGGRRRRRKETR